MNIKNWKVLSLAAVFCSSLGWVNVACGDTLDAILKAVRDPNSDGVAKLVKDAGNNDALRWQLLFNGQNGELPLLDSFVGGYLKKFVSIFMDEQTLQRARSVELSNYHNALQLLVTGNLQFNMNASAAKLNSANQQLMKDAQNLIGSANLNALKALVANNPLQPASLSTVGSVYYPSMEDLIGADRYDDAQQKRAALFVRTLLASASVMGDIVSEYSSKNHILTIYMPSAAESNGYRIISLTDMKEKEANEFRKKLNALSVYQKFKTKQSSLNAIRSIYTDNLIRSFTARLANVKVKQGLKDNSNLREYIKEETKSLAEIEKETARLALDGEYLERLKNGTLADFRIEELAALHRIVYFLHKLHQDYERLSFALSATAMQLTAADSSIEQSYYKPISNWIENQCWKDANSEKEQCQNLMTPNVGL